MLGGPSPCAPYLLQQQHRAGLQLPLLQQQAMHRALHLPWACPPPKKGSALPGGGSHSTEGWGVKGTSPKGSPVGSLKTAPASPLVLVRLLSITAMLGTLFLGSCRNAACGHPTAHTPPVPPPTHTPRGGGQGGGAGPPLTLRSTMTTL